MLSRIAQRMFASSAGETFFTANPLDRLHTLRSEPNALQRALALPEARYIPLFGDKCLIRKSPIELVILDGVDLRRRLRLDALEPAWIERNLLLLGQHVRDSTTFWTFNVPSSSSSSSAAFAIDEQSEKLVDVRFVARDLMHGGGSESAALMAHARALAGWHASHPFCAKCGGATAIAELGMKRACASCGAQHFPRTDPVAIALIYRDDKVLLGRQASWPAGRYSCVAGFVDVAESVEQAVRREVHEETGVALNAVRYFASQPWPSYSQLMIGCFAEAAPTAEIALNDKELEDARWFSRDELAAACAKPDNGNFLAAGDGSLMLPGKYAIARDLIEGFLANRHLVAKF